MRKNVTSVSQKIYLNQIITELDITKSLGPDGLLPIFFQRTAREMTTILHCVLKNIKRVRKLPDKWKVAAVLPIYKKGDKRLMEGNYRPMSLLNIMSKLLENACIQRCMTISSNISQEVSTVLLKTVQLLQTCYLSWKKSMKQITRTLKTMWSHSIPTSLRHTTKSRTTNY